MEKLLIVCFTDAQTNYAKAHLAKRGAKNITAEKVQDVSLAEAEGDLPDVDINGKYSQMGDHLILVTGSW